MLNRQFARRPELYRVRWKMLFSQPGRGVFRNTTSLLSRSSQAYGLFDELLLPVTAASVAVKRQKNNGKVGETRDVARPTRANEIGYPDRTAMGFIQPKRIQVKLLKPDLALALTWWSVAFPNSKQSVVGNSTMNLQKFSDGWKIVASHTSIAVM